MRGACLAFSLGLVGLLSSCAPERGNPMRTEPAEAHARSGFSKREFKEHVVLAHEAADKADSSKERLKAAQLIEHAFQQPATSATGIALRQELAARGASIWAELGREGAALELIQRGLRLDSEPTASRAQLFIARADLAEQQGHESEARDALTEALRINQQLFEEEMKEP